MSLFLRYLFIKKPMLLPLHLTWNPEPVLFHLGGYEFRWYTLFMISTLAMGILYMDHLLEKREVSWLNRFIFVILFGLSGMLGARLAHVFFYDWAYFAQHPDEILMVWKGGLASHGSVLGMLLALIIYTATHPKLRFLELMDPFVIIIPLGAGLIRLGNLINSELPGKAASVPWAFVFESYDLVPRHPVTLYESLSYFLLFGVFGWVFWKKQGKYKEGVFFGWMLVLLPLLRFLMEFFKDQSVGGIEGSVLNAGQLLSLPFVMAGLYFILRKKRVPDPTK